MKHFINTLNLDNNPNFSQGFAPSELSGVYWEILLEGIQISATHIEIPILFTGTNLENHRILKHEHTGDTNLGINSMADFVSYLYGIALSQPELQNSQPIEL